MLEPKALINAPLCLRVPPIDAAALPPVLLARDATFLVAPSALPATDLIID